MFTDNSLRKASVNLYNIVGNLSMNDYKRANLKDGKRKSRKHIPYSLSSETLQAKELYNIVFCNKAEDITQEQEEGIKAYILKIRMLQPELLEEIGGNKYFNISK